MGVLLGLLWPIERFNDAALALGRLLAIAALALMVVFILAQVFFRYVLGDALNWSEEAARFLMLWMTGLIAPLAYRQGGFVAIDMLERALPRVMSALLLLGMLIMAMIVIVTCVQLGWANVDSLSGRGRSATLRIPMDWLDMRDIRFRNQWAYASLFVGFVGLAIVNIELILRQIITLLGGGDRIKPLQDAGPID
ncbi:TRAP transporter small permease [Nereida sp. MMG025]|uniref:TRAP transporter small permease n=1 Tax=Nereida sp. MMG025 TaxID=2909981 RepID=UPI001F1CF6AB|nr:TRAP transporter small permease [Nereida sp. MMG025]MCF6445387.1 TRAP transporter small permease [Nereida sp. MMG025]